MPSHSAVANWGEAMAHQRRRRSMSDEEMSIEPHPFPKFVIFQTEAPRKQQNIMFQKKASRSTCSATEALSDQPTSSEDSSEDNNNDDQQSAYSFQSAQTHMEEDSSRNNNNNKNEEPGAPVRHVTINCGGMETGISSAEDAVKEEQSSGQSSSSEVVDKALLKPPSNANEKEGASPTKKSKKKKKGSIVDKAIPDPPNMHVEEKGAPHGDDAPAQVTAQDGGNTADKKKKNKKKALFKPPSNTKVHAEEEGVPHLAPFQAWPSTAQDDGDPAEQKKKKKARFTPPSTTNAKEEGVPQGDDKPSQASSSMAPGGGDDPKKKSEKKKKAMMVKPPSNTNMHDEEKGAPQGDNGPSQASSQEGGNNTADKKTKKIKKEKLPKAEEERQIVPFTNEAGGPTEEGQLVPYGPQLLQQRSASRPHYYRRNSRSNDLSSASQSLVPFKPLDPEEEERRRQEVDTAMEILEHMRRANLVMEFGPYVDLEECVFCLREERLRENEHARLNNLKPSFQKPKPKPRFGLPKMHHQKQCLICHSQVCKHHWDHGFLHQQNVILCQDCAPLFDLDNLVECMNLSGAIGESQQEQQLRRLLILYDRALLALRHSSQSFDDTARQQILQTNWHKESMGIGGHVTNIASGVTGIAATAVFMTPMGPWLLLTSLALGGIATAVGSGSFFIDRFCPSTRQAEQTIALASMVDSLLEATTILRQARITGTLPRPGYDSDDDDYETAKIKRVMIEADGSHNQSSTDLYLQEDKEQRLMITILKAKQERERRAGGNPIRVVFRRINNATKDRALEQQRKKHHQKFGQEEEEEQGPLKRAAFRFKRELNRAKDQAGEVVTVARTATTLAAVGMSAGGGGLMRQLSKRARGNGPFGTRDNTPKTEDEKDESTSTEEKEGNDKKPFRLDMNASAQHGLQVLARNFFDAAAEESRREQSEGRKKNKDEPKDHRNALVPRPMRSIPRATLPFAENIFIQVFVRTSSHSNGPVNSANERSLVDLKLRASERIMKAFTRTNFRVAGFKDRRKRLLANDSDPKDRPVDRVFVKNARFLVKASLTVLRETARYAGGAFSAAIVCVETMELKEKIVRIRGNGVRCSNADKLETLKHHLWENQNGSFPDTMTLEWELFANPKGEIEECVEGGTITPHWSSCFEGERPDGSCANLPIMEDWVGYDRRTL